MGHGLLFSSAVALTLLSGCGASAGAPGVGQAANTSQSTSCSATPSFVGSHMVSRADPTSPSQGASALNGKTHMKRLRGHVLWANRSAHDLGKMDDTRELPITVTLQLNHQSQLEQELAEIYRPGSPRFHQFLKPEEFRAKYSPTQAQIAQVTRYLTQKGLSSISVDPNGLVHARGKVADLNNAFGTEIHQYQSKNGRNYFGPQSELQVPQGLPIQGVHGLQNYMHFHDHLQQAPSGSTTSHGGTGPGGAFSPSDIHSAYNLPASLDGSGQTLAVFELDGYNASDVTTYERQFGLPAMPLQNVLVDGATGAAGGGAAEVCLDLELMIAVAPKASRILVYEGPGTDQGILDTYSRIASDNLAKSISTSWGDSEDTVTSSFMQAENNIFMQMAAQGQTIYSAAGDTGANDNGRSLSVDDPSAQPYVVAVGGTSLTTDSSGQRANETTWNDSAGAGGGGISSVWTIPSWQQGLSMSQAKGSTTMRNIPDVALNSDIETGYAIFTGGSWGTWGGTSAAAPLWAAFNALVNQKRASNGLAPIGYITPLLYSIGDGNRYGSDFFDIADGSTNQYYSAVTGYDDATGWGSFNGANLLQDLSQDPASTSSGSTTSTSGTSSTQNSCTTGA